MAKIKVHPTDPTMYMYWDVATNQANAFRISDDRGWSWNGDFDCPTVQPSILTTLPTAHGVERNHVFIRSGKVQYLSDCTHALAGQTVDMVEFPEEEW